MCSEIQYQMQFSRAYCVPTGDHLVTCGNTIIQHCISRHNFDFNIVSLPLTQSVQEMTVSNSTESQLSRSSILVSIERVVGEQDLV